MDTTNLTSSSTPNPDRQARPGDLASPRWRSRPLAVALVGLVVLTTAVWGGWSLVQSEDLAVCEPSGPVLTETVETVDVNWEAFVGAAPITSITSLRGEGPGSRPAVICEKIFLDFPAPFDPIANLSLHRYPSADVALAEFSGFFQDAIDYGSELEPGHRYQLEDPQRSAHLVPDSCLVIAMTWGPDNDWSPQQRHAAVVEALQPVGEIAC